MQHERAEGRMDGHLEELLHRWNPWLDFPERWPAAARERLPEVFVERMPARQGLIPAPGDPRALVVVGPRQAGKSTYLWSLLAGRHDSVLYLNGEESLVQQWCASPGLFSADLETLPGPPEAIFIDEAQHLPNAGLFVKGLVDLPTPLSVYVTGSSAFHLRDRVRESLAGRAARLVLAPFSMMELLGHQGNRARSRARQTILDRMLLFGGYPDVFLKGNEEGRLLDLVEAFVMRDASDVYRIQRPDAFRRLLRLAAAQVGGPVNLTEWGALTGLSVNTVGDYLAVFEESWVAMRVPLFRGGKRAEMTRTPKLYFVDNGLRNRLVGDFSPASYRSDAGALFENWVFSELIKCLISHEDLHYWRTRGGAEVDFVLHRPGSAPVAVEAKLGHRPGRISRGVRSFLEAYRPEVFLTVCPGGEGEAEILGVPCRWIRPDQLVAALPRRFRKV